MRTAVLETKSTKKSSNKILKNNVVKILPFSVKKNGVKDQNFVFLKLNLGPQIFSQIGCREIYWLGQICMISE